MILYNIKRRFTSFIHGVRFYHRYKIDRCNYQKIADKQGIALSCMEGVKMIILLNGKEYRRESLS